MLVGDICVGVSVGGQSYKVISCSRFSIILCEKCNKHDDNCIMYVQTLSEVVNEFKYKRGLWESDQRRF